MWPWPFTLKHEYCSWHTVLSWWTFVSTYFKITLYMAKIHSGHANWQQILTNKCDLHLWPTCMGIVRDTPPCDGELLCQVILKSHDLWRSYALNTNCWRRPYTSPPARPTIYYANPNSENPEVKGHNLTNIKPSGAHLHMLVSIPVTFYDSGAYTFWDMQHTRF